MDDDCKVIPEGTKNDEGVNKDEGKVRLDLVPPEVIMALGDALTYGTKGKYEDRNWEKGIAWSRTYASLMRHLMAWLMSEDELDEESKLTHLEAALFRLSCLITYERRQMYKFDDLTVRRDV